jgi:hypothetical protein
MNLVRLRYNAAFWIAVGDAVRSAMIFRSDPRQWSQLSPIYASFTVKLYFSLLN